MIPNTRPGETITVQLTTTADRQMVSADFERSGPIPEEERAAIVELAHEIRKELGDCDERLSSTHGDLLYDENDPPK